MLEAAAGFKGSPSDVTAQLDKAVEQGLNTVRAFAFGTEEGFALQRTPGQYDEATFKALDFVLDEARKRNLRLVLALANNWPSANTDEKRRSGANSDNKFAYADAVGAIKIVNGRVVGEDAFFTDPKAKQAYKDHLSVLANRVNSINGRKYKGEYWEGREFFVSCTFSFLLNPRLPEFIKIFLAFVLLSTEKN